MLLWLSWEPAAPVLPVGASSLPTFSLHGPGAPPLTNGQTLSGTVRFIVQPFFATREHGVSITLEMLNEPCMPPLVRQAWEVVFNTTMIPNGEHQLKMEPFRVPGPFERFIQSLRPPFEQLVPLPVQTWTVFVTNSNTDAKRMRPAAER
jgi:hypothetical protein